MTNVVILLLDNLRVQDSKSVKPRFAERSTQIEVFHLASISPELNREEQLNAGFKQAMGKRERFTK